MVVVKIWCLPQLAQEEFEDLFKKIVKFMKTIKELGVKDKHSMLVLFPADLMDAGLGEEILIEVSGLFFFAPEVQQRTTTGLKRLVKSKFRRSCVECHMSTSREYR